MNNEECKDCKEFNRLREVEIGRCMPVAKYLDNNAVNPMLVPASFGCVLWEPKNQTCEPQRAGRKGE